MRHGIPGGRGGPDTLRITAAREDRFDDHEGVLMVRDKAAGLCAIIAIHSTALGPAFGGCRMHAYASPRLALRDALRLSRAMSYKAALAGVPFGGGKCVVLADPVSGKTPALLAALGRAIDQLGGRYLTADDVGTTVGDMEVLRQVTRHARGLPGPDGEACPATAFGVFLAIQAAVRHRLGRSDLQGLSVAVQGLGNVGSRLCAYLANAGATLRVSDLRRDRVARICQAYGAIPVEPERILAEPVDVLSPNALGAVFDDASIPTVRAAVVAGAANTQLAEDRHGVALHRRGVVYVPDYVANAGGLIDVAGEGPSYCRDRVLRACESIRERTASLLAESARLGIAPSSLADTMAEAVLRAGRSRRADREVGRVVEASL